MTAILVALAAALAQEPAPRLAATAAPFPDDACGTLSALPQDPAPSPMLADRLRLTLRTTVVPLPYEDLAEGTWQGDELEGALQVLGYVDP